MCNFDQTGEQYRIAREKPPAYINIGWFFETAHEIPDGKVAVPASARPLLHEIGSYVHEAKAGS